MTIKIKPEPAADTAYAKLEARYTDALHRPFAAEGERDKLRAIGCELRATLARMTGDA